MNSLSLIPGHLYLTRFGLLQQFDGFNTIDQRIFIPPKNHVMILNTRVLEDTETWFKVPIVKITLLYKSYILDVHLFESNLHEILTEVS